MIILTSTTPTNLTVGLLGAGEMSVIPAPKNDDLWRWLVPFGGLVVVGEVFWCVYIQSYISHASRRNHRLATQGYRHQNAL